MSNQSAPIVLQGDFDARMAQFFKEELRKRSENSTVFVRIDSIGGNGHSMNLMSGFMVVMAKYKKCRFIAQIARAESVALIFAVNMHERHVLKTSVGSIHLPVRNANVIIGAHEPILEIKNKSVIAHFVSRTKLTSEDIFSLEQKELYGEQMVHYGIATSLVETFNPLA